MNRIESPFTNAKHGRSAAALFSVVLALAGFANAEAMSSAHSHKVKKGYFTITTATEVGGVTLEPGDYSAKEVNTPSGPSVEFEHIFFNYLAQDIMQGNQYEVVGRVPVTEKELSALPKKTRLILESDTPEAVSLKIRGSAVGYEFPTSQAAGAAKDHPAAMGSNAGQE